MVRALGYSVDEFDPVAPGRLCRGRERWVESFPVDDPEVLKRVVISGACFSDETAKDATRGVLESGLGLGQVVMSLLGGKTLVAACEEGHPRLVPEGACQVEDYTITRPTGRLREWGTRWLMPVADAGSIDRACEAGAEVILVLPAGSPSELSDVVRDTIFLLNGFRDEEPPMRRFQPAALPVLLDHAEAVVLIHLDKHAPALGVYSRKELDPSEALDELCTGVGVLAVPFAIPPMLARWDRALWELRQTWHAEERGEFPVPPGPERSYGWGRKSRGRSRDEE